MNNTISLKSIAHALPVIALLSIFPVALPALGHIPINSEYDIFALLAMMLVPPFLFASISKFFLLKRFLSAGLDEEINPWSRLRRQSALDSGELFLYMGIFWVGYLLSNGFASRNSNSVLLLLAAIGIPLSLIGHWLLLRRYLDDLRPSIQIFQCLLLASLFPISFYFWLKIFSR